MKTAFTYHRYSTELQRDGYTLEAQRNITKAIADKNNLKIIQVYEDEAISGATIEKRPAMLQLLEDLPKLKPSYLIATDQDRIARGNDFWLIKNALAKNKTSIITEKEGVIDVEDITKDALSDMIAVFAKLERKMIGRRVSRGIIQKGLKGNFIGNIITGYKKQDNKLVIDEDQAAIVRQAFNMIIEGKTTTAIMKYFVRNKIKTARGKNYTLKTVTRILRNPTYIGKVRVDNKIVDGLHEPIIDEITFKRAQKILDSRNRVNYTKPANYLLTGYIRCGICGVKMKASMDYKSKYVNGKIVRYGHGYICYNRANAVCNNAITGSIENMIFNQIKDKIKELKLNIKDGLHEYLLANRKKNKINLEDEIEKIDLKMSKLLDKYLDDSIDEITYNRKNNELKNTKELLLRQNKKDDDKDMMYSIYEYIKKFNINHMDKLDFEAKRELLNIFIKQIIIKKAEYQGCRNANARVEIEWKY